ncbi:MAG: hypothetical protein EOP04_26790 [Proteobacteria bacterium]|nr:MAG: hypothetical protein EOP04_26790 [Pseudomonadota bacterium]
MSEDPIWIMNRDGTEEVCLTADDLSFYMPSFSPDGKQLTFVSFEDSGALFVIDVDGTNQKRLVEGTGPSSPVFTADGKSVIYQDDFKQFFIVDTDGQNQQNLFEHPPHIFSRVIVNPLGEQIAFCEQTSFELTDWINEEGYLDENGEIEESANEPEDRYTIVLSNLDGSGRLYPGSDFWNLIQPAFSPDGLYCAALGRKNKSDLPLLYIFRTDGSEVTTIDYRRHGLSPTLLQWVEE